MCNPCNSMVLTAFNQGFVFPKVYPYVYSFRVVQLQVVPATRTQSDCTAFVIQFTGSNMFWQKRDAWNRQFSWKWTAA